MNKLMQYLALLWLALPLSVLAQPMFVDNQQCLSCHETEAKQWQGSHHDQAMQVANETTVLGDFNDAEFTAAGVTSRFFRKDGKYFIHTQGADSKMADFEVKYTFGVDPLQQYLLALPKGQLQAFTLAWDINNKRWFDLHPDDDTPPGDPLHWASRAFTGNSSCIECHTTNMQLNFDVEQQQYNTHWDEVNVSCQSCHGPGSEHVAWAAQEDKAVQSTNKGLSVDYKAMDSKQFVDSCARCHSRRYAMSENDTHGNAYLDDFMPELLRQESYHADGQIKDEVYVYGSFVQSKMYHQGVSCNDCHNPHTLKLRQQGNGLCVSCHQAKPPTARFASLPAAEYDTEKHHFHPPNSAGAQCVNCHMPTTTYMQIDPRRDHSFSIPRPDLSAKYDTPDACTKCHADKSAQWAVEAMNTWYGKTWQHRPSITPLLTQARQGDAAALQPLVALLQDPEQAAIIRATALDLLPQYGQASFEASFKALQDESALVRVTALQALANAPLERIFKAVPPLLNDKVRAVRIEAANVLAAVPRQQFREKELQQLDKALAEYKSAQLALADHPEGHVNLGNLYARMGQAEPAQQAYETAIKMDASFMPAYSSLGQLFYALGQRQQAAETFLQAVRKNPKAGSVHYSLGLLLTEMRQPDTALEHLEQAVTLMPDNLAAHYNYGLLLQRQQQIAKAEAVLLHAHDIAPQDPRTLQALIALYRGQPGKAKPFMQRLKALQTGSP